MDHKQLTVREQPGELAVPDLLNQVRKIQEVMVAVMKDGEHYGTIPGTKKKSLLKPGAEKLGFTFRLAPRFEVEIVPLAGEHREVRVKCSLWHIPSNTLVAEGVGSCSTAESKYRYRNAEPEDTGKAVPGAYWEARKQDQDKATELLGGKGYVAKKTDAGQWHIFKLTGAKIENPDVADQYNTVLKMAKKRAHVDAILTATAASDIFAQDLEDLPGAQVVEPEVELNQVVISEAQRKRLFALAKDGKHSDQEVKEWLFVTFGVTSSREILTKQYEAICARLQQPGPLLEPEPPPWEPPLREPGDEPTFANVNDEPGFV
jgi:hypothetical protein